jgi:hypothetical protein
MTVAVLLNKAKASNLKAKSLKLHFTSSLFYEGWPLKKCVKRPKM